MNEVFLLGLPSMSKFLNEDLGGMTKISEQDPNMNMKRGVLITGGSMQILTLTIWINGTSLSPWITID